MKPAAILLPRPRDSRTQVGILKQPGVIGVDGRRLWHRLTGVLSQAAHLLCVPTMLILSLLDQFRLALLYFRILVLELDVDSRRMKQRVVD